MLSQKLLSMISRALRTISSAHPVLTRPPPRLLSRRHVLLLQPLRTQSSTTRSRQLTIEDQTHPTDTQTNVPSHLLPLTIRKLHLQPDHPLSITRKIIESRFPPPTYKYHNTYHPAVSLHQNFDSLRVPPDHPSRAKTDTYYINADTVLRTHTSAHQADTFRRNESAGFLISADVYRRDAVDATHFPVFHQMEGARVWDRRECNVAKAARDDLAALPKHNMLVEDPNPTTHPERNPLQAAHFPDEADAVATHMKRSIENAVAEIFSRATAAAGREGEEPLRVRWVETYFPFTSPSWELEIWWKGDWLEVLGCGVILQELLDDAGAPSQVGWAFGLGLERVAMLLFDVPDIRLFWSRDPRFLEQFGESGELRKFVPFSRHPECYKDVSFWLPQGGSGSFHENDLMELIRTTAGSDVVESVVLADSFSHPQTRRQSRMYRVNYRSLERTLTNAEVNEIHARVCEELVGVLGVEIR